MTRLAFVLPPESTEVTATWLREVAVAIAVQLQRDVAPAYGLVAPEVDLVIFTSMAAVPELVTPCVVLTDSDQAKAIGYHAETAFGRAYARIFTAGLDRDGISEVCSHEAGETTVDPHCNGYRMGSDGRLYWDEPFDAVQGQRYGINGIMVANFVWPSWYDPMPDEDPGQVDQMGLLSRPISISPGGYVGTSTGQILGYGQPQDSKSHPASRTARRMKMVLR